MSESKPGKASSGDSSSKNENKSGKGPSGDGSSRNENKLSKCSSAESSRDDGGRSASRKYDDRGRGRYEDERPYPGRVKSNYDEDRRYKGKGGYDDERPRSSRGKSDHYDDRSRSNRGKDDDRSYSAKSRSGYEDDRYYDRGNSSQSKSGRGEFKRGGNSESQKGINKSRSENYSGYSDKGNSRKSSDRDVRSGDKGSIKNDKGTPKVDKASYNSTKNSKGASGDTKDRKNKMSDKTEKKDKDVKSSGKTAEFKSAADLEAQWQKEEEEKQKKEAEEQKRQEEIKRKEEEEKRKAEEEAKRLLEEEKKSIEDFIQESKDRNELKQKQREENLHAIENKPDESFYRKLDSSLKKNTAFVKKLKNLTESQKDSITKDFNGLNLTKYIGEVAAAITEAKLKMSDIPCAIHICCIMHQRYPEFYQALLENWQKCLLSKKDEKINNPSKYRVDLRFFADLIAVGVFPLKEAVGVLAGQLSLLMNNDKEEHNNLTIITSFCKHCGDDYVGLVPRRYRLLAEKYELDIPQSQFLPPDKHKGCRSLLSDYYQSLCKHLIKDHEEVKKLEHQNRRQLQTKGELSTERKEVFEKVWTAFQKLHENTSVFADLLDQDMPDLPEDNYKKDEEAGFDIFNPEKNAEFQYVGDSTLFEDEDARTFYETLPDLKAFIPGICYKDSEQAAGKDETKEEINELEEDIENLQIEDVEREMETEQQIAEVENTEAENVQDAENLHNDGEEMRELDLELEEDETDSGSLMKIQLEAYLQSLPNCVNRELIDKAGIEFCMNFNTKINRKKLVRALFTVHRTRYDLLPFYSRMVATLFPCMPDVANDLVQLLKSDFRWHVRKKDQINIESKLKTVRFIGELVKFKLFPKSEALHCLKMLMFDFSHHNIEMACTLLDTCGRFLYRSQDSHHRTKIYLDIMMRKKSSLHLENRYTTMIENAFYYSNPPETSQIARKVRPPLHEYVRKLLYKDLSKSTTERVLRQMRKLDWDDPEIAFYATKSLIAIWNIRYNSIHCAANLLAGLAPYHEHVAVQVVDGVLEDTRLGMEINHPKYNQRRVSCIKYLGELYNYRMVESAVIFKTLYSFITFGVSLDESNPSPLDVPEHLFRIRLTCVLLETCGTYFDKGSSKKKLDCFIVYFQRYYWFKRKHPIWCETRPFPIDVENLVHDTMELIRPKTKLFTNFEDAQKAVEDIENEYKDKVAAVLPLIDPDQDGSASENEEGLSTIQESDENCASEGELSGYEIDESQDSTEEASQSQKSRDGEESEGERVDPEEEEWMELAGELDEEDEITVLTGGPKHVKCSEDEDFMAAFDKMMNENIQARTNESLKVPQLDIAVPMHLKDKTKKAAANVSLYSTEEDETPVPKQKNAIEFVLMTRRGNKQQFTNLNVPISAEFAAKYKEREQAEKAEKERMKQVVLGIHERQEEEDYQERIAALNKQMPVNTNRERRVRYQHPKGAPDADLIFGSSKR